MFIDDAPDEPAPPRTLLMDQKRCAYQPPLLVAHTGEMLTVKNSDPLVHNVRAQSAGTDLFNVAMPIENLTIRRMMPMTPGLVHVGCDVHPWMRADVYAAGAQPLGRHRCQRRVPHRRRRSRQAPGAHLARGAG